MYLNVHLMAVVADENITISDNVMSIPVTPATVFTNSSIGFLKDETQLFQIRPFANHILLSGGGWVPPPPGPMSLSPWTYTLPQKSLVPEIPTLLGTG